MSESDPPKPSASGPTATPLPALPAHMMSFRGASAPPAPIRSRSGHRRSRSTSSHSEHFEDARGEPFTVSNAAAQQQREAGPSERVKSDAADDDLDFLPPLETFFSLVSDHAVSLSGSCLEENDLLPSTPLTEEQLRRADSVLKEDLEVR